MSSPRKKKSDIVQATKLLCLSRNVHWCYSEIVIIVMEDRCLSLLQLEDAKQQIQKNIIEITTGPIKRLSPEINPKE